MKTRVKQLKHEIKERSKDLVALQTKSQEVLDQIEKASLELIKIANE